MASGSEKRQRGIRKSIRYSTDEFNRVSEKADRAGLGFAGFVRAASLDGDAGPRAKRRPPADHRALRQILGHLGRIGNNINQIAKSLNSGDRLKLRELEAALRAYLDIRNAIFDALNKDPVTGKDREPEKTPEKDPLPTKKAPGP